MEKWNTIGNFKKVSDNRAVLVFDTRIYNVEIINAVAQYMIGKCHTILAIDEHDSNNIVAEIITEHANVDELIYEFNEETINYAFYSGMMEKKGKLREAILERVLLCAQKKAVVSATN